MGVTAVTHAAELISSSPERDPEVYVVDSTSSAQPTPHGAVEVEKTALSSWTPVAPCAREANAAPVEVPERQLRTELQAFLVGVDLAAMTIGELRVRLEKRLGLGAGVLSSRKRLRRQLSWAVQEEVVKKVRRNTDCERIMKALIDFKGCPDSAKQMLIDGLPQAVVHIGVPQAHQARFLQIVHDALV